MQQEGGRIRDPERRERILAAAAELIARRGYNGVSLSDIGAAAGIVGSGVYRHFDTKVAILVEMFDRVIDRLVAEAEEMLRASEQPEVALAWLVRGQVQFTMGERSLCQVYLQEARNLPDADLRRLKWKQRHYVDLWLDLLRSAHPEFTVGEVQVRVHSAISAVHSVLRYHPLLDDASLAHALESSGCRLLEIAPLTAASPGATQPATPFLDGAHATRGPTVAAG
jgi:AcrR family transcriptional regulator